MATAKKTSAKKAPAKKAASSKATAKKVASKKTASAKTDATVLLHKDHAEVSKGFKQYAKLLKTKAAASERRQLAEHLCRLLTVHAQIEEEIFYPAARAAGVEAALVDEADVEHAVAKDLMGYIESMKPGDAHYDAKVTVLGEYIAHHVEEEEEEMFPKCRKAKMDLAGLASQLASRKSELTAQLGNAPPKQMTARVKR